MHLLRFQSSTCYHYNIAKTKPLPRFSFFFSGMLTYRVFRNERKRQLKLAHAAINLTAFVLAVVALEAVFAFHNASDIPNMYSLHSWLGIATVALFAFQVSKCDCTVP